MNYCIHNKENSGFSLLEVMVCLLILLPIMGAAVQFFSVGINQHTTEQSSIDMNQEARSGFEMMIAELAQAGSHDATGAASAVTTGTIAVPSTTPQPLTVSSTAGITAGDYIFVDSGASQEYVEVTAVSSTAVTAEFRTQHSIVGVPVRLFALPYTGGVITAANPGRNTAIAVNAIKFFGDINGDGNLSYGEYAYHVNNDGTAQITRSMTPLTQGAKNAAQPIISRIKPGSVQFILYTDNQQIVTSIDIQMTVEDTVMTGNKRQEVTLSSRVVIPSAIAASALFNQNQIYGGVNMIPPTPSQVIAWAR
jgi:prepilin-type N-terminal cleavage/methylation domain-containing protein